MASLPSTEPTAADKALKVAVMGAGAVGCYYGGMLARAGHEVTLIARPQHAQAIASGGLRLQTTAFDERVRIRIRDVVPGDRDRPRQRPAQARYRFDQFRLAVALHAGDRHDLTGAHFEIEIEHFVLSASVGHVEAPHRKHGLAGLGRWPVAQRTVRMPVPARDRCVTPSAVESGRGAGPASDTSLSSPWARTWSSTRRRNRASRASATCAVSA